MKFNAVSGGSIPMRFPCCSKMIMLFTLFLLGRCSKFYLLLCVLWLATRWIKVEKVPFSRRRHLVFTWPELNSCVKNSYLNKRLKKMIDEEILPPMHPASLRATSMVRDVAHAMHNVLGLSKDCTVRGYAPDQDQRNKGQVWIVGESERREHVTTRGWEIRRGRFGTEHLEGCDWKVVVFDSQVTMAKTITYYNTIILSRGMIDSFSDAELAVVIGHEFGHAIARHYFDNILAKLFGLPVTIAKVVTLSKYCILQPRYMPQLWTHKLQEFTLYLDRRRCELEADYIGMILMASTGYDPQVAPKLVRMQNKKTTATHPSSDRRADFLEKPAIMKLPMDVYKEVLKAIG